MAELRKDSKERAGKNIMQASDIMEKLDSFDGARTMYINQSGESFSDNVAVGVVLMRMPGQQP